MQAPLTKKTDRKLFILYLMYKIGYPLDFSTINDITCIDGIISGFDFAECFSELLNAGNVTEVRSEKGDLYKLSERGVNIVEALYNSLIPSLREQALKSAMKLLSFRNTGRITTQRVETDSENGQRRLILTVEDDNGIQFALTLAVDEVGVMDKMQNNFNKRPEEIYRAIYGLLAGDAGFLSD